MSKHTFAFTATAKVVFIHHDGAKTSAVHESKVALTISDNLDRKQYFTNELPTEAGCKALTSALVVGIVTNIKYAHEKGFWNEVEHVKKVIDDISRGFATHAISSPGKIGDHNP